MKQLRIDANGLTFAAFAWGEPDAPLALLVHGYPDTAHTWRHLGPELAETGYRAVAPFTRGYAPTDLAPNDSTSSPTRPPTSSRCTPPSAATTTPS
jgi:pimeloyl-ACP methyl ester carboxylesterase